MIKVVLILFLIGHVLGDFYLQNSGLATDKNKSFKKLLQHSSIYLLSMIFVTIPVFSFSLLKWSCVIAFTHFIIDLLKILITKKITIANKANVLLYSIDQIAHIFIICFITLTIDLLSEPIHYINCIQYLLNRLEINVLPILSWILAILMIAQPFSITIRNTLYHFRPEADKSSEGVSNAGALIGIFERSIILLLLFMKQYSAIGFVLTAKSIARYNRIAEDPKFAEYYLLGTLLSTLLVIIIYLFIF